MESWKHQVIRYHETVIDGQTVRAVTVISPDFDTEAEAREFAAGLEDQSDLGLAAYDASARYDAAETEGGDHD